MSQTYHDLTSLDEPDIFDIDINQKHILNQLIHFALKNWDACQIYYHVCRCSAIKKNSPFCFVPRSWKKVYPPAYSTDYVQNTCDKTYLKPKANASSTTQKNNWLHMGTDLFTKHCDKHIGFGFLLAIK